MCHIQEFMYMTTLNRCLLTTFVMHTESQNTSANSKKNMAVMASNGPSPNSLSLRLGLPAPQPSRHHHAQSLLGPSFHDPGTHHVPESHPSKPRLSPTTTMSDVTPSALTLSLHCASILQPTTPPQVVAFQSETISAPICLNRFTFAGSRKSDL